MNGMAQDSVERLFGRLITDAAFREYARSHFHKACLEMGLTFSREERHLISRIDFGKFEELAKEIDGGLKRCGIMKEGNQSLMNNSSSGDIKE